MAESGGKAPPKKGAEKKSGGGFWGFLGNVLSNVSVDINVGKPTRSGATSRNPTDPADRMQPVHEEREEAYQETIYRKTEGNDGTAPAVRVDRDRKHIARSLDQRMAAQSEARIPQSGGAPLSRDVRAKMEPRLGSDLSGVRVHTGGESATAAQDLSAKAFTVGSDFGSGQYQPGTKEGDKLIAHELTHVVQGQRSGIQRKAATPVNDDAGLEREADATGAKAAHGAPDAAHGHEAGHEVSQPGDPAEKEADAVADHVAGDIHGDGDKGGDKSAHAGAGGHGGGADKSGAHKGDANAAPSGDSKSASSGSASKAGDAGGAVKEQAPKVGTKRIATAAPPIQQTYVGIGRKIHRKPAPQPATPAQGAKPAAPGAKPAETKKTPFQEIGIDTTFNQKVSVKQAGTKLVMKIGSFNAVNALQDVIDAKPLADAKNKTALQLFQKAQTTVLKASGGVDAITGVTADGVDKGVQDQAQKCASDAAGAIDTLKTGIGLDTLARAKKIEPLPAVEETFAPDKQNLPPENAKAAFKEELTRQLGLQQSGMNKLSLDEWMANVDTYQSGEQSWFTQINEEAKKVVLKELIDRMKNLEETLQKKMPVFRSARDLVNALVDAQEKKKALGPKAKASEKKAADDLVKAAADAAMANAYVKNNVIGRHGDEEDFRSKHAAGLQAVLDKNAEKWNLLDQRVKTSGAILHNPDQVAGGKGNIPDFEPVPAPGEEDFDEEKWEAYTKKLEKFIGSSKVNSTIGGQWSDKVKAHRATYDADPGPKGFPFHKMNFKFKPGAF